jgi:sigma-B regulation protein RsbU (phosphoserine phosphatase)
MLPHVAARPTQGTLTKSANPIRRAIGYAFYDWTREMSTAKRLAAWSGIFLQGWAIWAATMRSIGGGPNLSANGIATNLGIAGIYLLGYCITNATLTSELLRKTELEADQAAARQIQQTLIPQQVEPVPGYAVATHYRPFREVGGDYFDVIPLPGDDTLIVIADVSGKGMPAALLSANIQALVRSRTHRNLDLVDIAQQISAHVNAYTPMERYATAAFILLHRATGEVTYVNAGHNPPMIAGPASQELEATGVPLGLFPNATYEARTAALPPGATLLVYTDGLTDSIAGEAPERQVRAAILGTPAETLARLTKLIQPKLAADDVTLVVVRRAG